MIELIQCTPASVIAMIIVLLCTNLITVTYLLDLWEANTIYKVELEGITKDLQELNDHG